MFRNCMGVLESEIDGSRAWDRAGAIHAVDRRFTFSSFHESARLSAGFLQDAGLSGVEILEAPADGRSVFGDWMMPLAWEARRATFDLLCADGRSERLADRDETPACLAMWSAPTPSDGVQADLVCIDDPAADPEALARGAARGKIVFTSAHPASVKRLLLDSGAVGILSDFQSAGADLPDATAWVNAFGDHSGEWGLLARHARGWSFQIPPRLGWQLRARLAAGERLQGRAVVDTTILEGTLPTVTGLIPGSSPEEVLLLGHQFEQGALDNASGVTAMVEAARALQHLIAQGKLSPPKRSIRFLFISECYTTIFWATQRSKTRPIVAALCLDSPAGVPSLALRPIEIAGNPHSQMSFVDALVVHLADQVISSAPTYAWRDLPFAMGTDNFIADTTIGIPCPWIGSHSRTWHTSADTPEVVDPSLLALTARIAGAYAYLVAAADGESVRDFAYLAAARAQAILSRAFADELTHLRDRDLDDSLRQIVYLADRQAEAVASPLKLLPRSGRSALRREVQSLQRGVRRLGRDSAAALARRAGRPGHVPPTIDPPPALSAIRPRRLLLGPLTFDRVPPEQREGNASPRWSAELFSLLNWCDGRRSLADAAALAARELRRDRALSPDELGRAIDPNAGSMLEYADFLRRRGYIDW
jgi:hypothetical protein